MQDDDERSTMTPSLYLISPDIQDIQEFSKTLESVLEAVPIPAFQLRLKKADDMIITHIVHQLKPICIRYNTAFILNDRADLAASLDMDGVHLGKDDMSVTMARHIVGHHRTIGASCYNSIDTAITASMDGADYVAFGSIYPTMTKDNPTVAEIEIVHRWADMSTTPCVAIGGITLDNVTEVAKSKADFIAVSRGVWHHPLGPAVAVKKFYEILGAP
jgi:thiamine-phosphate pyrophosphorylase